MQHTEEKFQGDGGFDLFMQSWLPDGDKRAVIILIHGLGEHSSRYQNVVDALVPQGYAIYSFDHRGHGRSPDRQCAHVNDWSEYRSDMRAFVQLVQQREPGLPLFIYGHSMGGLITLEYVLHHPEGLAGVIASAPAVSEVEASPLLLAIGRLMARLKPDFSLDSGLDVTGISRDTAVVEAYQKDPLVHGKVSARWSTAFTGAIAWTQAHAADFQPPLLILHGEADRLVAPAGSQTFFENVRQPDKQRIVYPGGYHEPHNDIQKEQVLADVSEWLAKHA
ncbi:MAG: lysophospholipase [Ardenticatenaceae bacterium]|nr:lysophospholipase [Anaerolineales bacterium]MCB8920887.1 lysophospholipase [Ardenticatenaceae bacterium]